MKLVYVAGPYRAKDRWEVERNIFAARKLGVFLASLGVVPVIPHAMYSAFDGTETDEFWLEATQEILKRCDMLYMLPGWKDSEGSLQELGIALALEIPVAYSLGELCDLLR